MFAPDGSVAVTEYSWDNDRLAMVDREGLVAKFGYDPDGAPLSVQVGEGCTRSAPMCGGRPWS